MEMAWSARCAKGGFMQVDVEISSDSLLLELDDLKRVDWPSIWAGPPQGGSDEFRSWCDRYGWESRTVEGDPEIVTRHGSTLDFMTRGRWHPVVSVNANLWRLSTELPEEKSRVVSEGIQPWKSYLKAVSDSLGEPTGAGSVEEQNFPTPPREGLWQVPDYPPVGGLYRLAYWESFGGCTEGPIAILSQAVPLYTWKPFGGGGASISLRLRSPFLVGLND